MTNLSTKEIRGSIKKFKKLYLVIQSKLKNWLKTIYSYAKTTKKRNQFN
jgi:hypothetical protein